MRLESLEQFLFKSSFRSPGQTTEVPKGLTDEVLIKQSEGNQSFPNYTTIDDWIKNGSDADRAEIIPQLEPFGTMPCCENSSDFWWRYAVGQYFEAVSIYERGRGSVKEITIRKIRAASASIGRASELNRKNSSEVFTWYVLKRKFKFKNQT